jgi:sec-independent protein translocase protein TatA
VNELSFLLLAGIPGGMELWIILLIILILFGSRLPGIARSLGQGISQFKKGLSDVQDENDKGTSAKGTPKDDAGKSS